MTVTCVCCPVVLVKCIGQGSWMWLKEAGSEATVDARSTPLHLLTVVSPPHWWHIHTLHITVVIDFGLKFEHMGYLARPLTLPCMPNLVHSHSQHIDTHFSPGNCSGFLSHDIGVQRKSNLNITAL